MRKTKKLHYVAVDGPCKELFFPWPTHQLDAPLDDRIPPTISFTPDGQYDRCYDEEAERYWYQWSQWADATDNRQPAGH